MFLLFISFIGAPSKTPQRKGRGNDASPDQIMNVVKLDPKSVSLGRRTPRRQTSVKDEPSSPAKADQSRVTRKRGQRGNKESSQELNEEMDSSESLTSEKIYPPTNGEPETSKDIENDFYDGTNDVRNVSGSDIDDEEVNKNETWCVDCGDLFEENFSWRAHMASHHWHCKGCQVQFLHLEPFEIHMASCPRKGDPKLAKKTQLPEIRISSKFNEEYQGCFRLLKLHFLKKGATRNATCIACNQHGELKHIKKHIQEMHAHEKHRKYLCGWCSKAFVDRSKCLKHETTCCENSTRQAQESTLTGIIKKLVIPDAKDVIKNFPQNEGENLTFECKPCSLEFPYDSAWREHMARNHWGCPACKVLFLDPQPWEDHKANCEVAAGLDDTPLKLLPIKISRIHDNDGASLKLMRINFATSNGRGWIGECLKCPMSYLVNLSNLKRHIQFKHTNEKNFYCLLCNRGYVEKNAMQKHMKKAHREQLIKFSEQSVEIKESEEENEDDILTENDDIIISRVLKKEEVVIECTECSLSFQGDSQWRTHMATTHWSCATCRVMFVHEQPWNDHKQWCSDEAAASGSEENKCDLQLENSYSKAEEEHLKYIKINFNDIEKPFTECVLCDFTCPAGNENEKANISQIEVHIQDQHFTVPCQFCKRSFVREEDCREHENSCPMKMFKEQTTEKEEQMDAEDSKNIQEETMDIDLKESQKLDPEDKEYLKCEHCSMDFGKDCQWREHMACIHWACPKCQVLFLHEEPWNNHKAGCEYAATFTSSGEPIFRLKIVKNYDPKDDSLKVLKVKFNGEKKYTVVCMACNKFYVGTVTKLVRHIQYQHTKHSNFFCRFCDKGHVEKTRCEEHEKSCSQNPEKFKKFNILGAKMLESAADKTLIENGNDESNMDISENLGEQSCFCEMCETEFPSDSQWRSHMASNHWGCPKCEVMYLHEDPWNQHRSMCEDAQKYDDSLKNLLSIDIRKSHNKDLASFKYIKIKVPEGEKWEAECLECGKCFVESLSKLKIHIQVKHTFEKNYFCKFCNKGFVEVGKGKKHENVCLRQMVLVKSKQALDIDLSDNTQDLQQTCETCDVTYQKDFQFRQHMAISHWICVKCKWQFLDSEPYEEHKQKFHPGESIEVDQCDIGTLDWIYQPNLKKFAGVRDLTFYKNVVIRQLDNRDRSIECTACQPHDFRDLVSLKRHIIASHTRNMR